MTGTTLEQPSIRAVPDRVWDVVVVGAGPAGSTAALHLAAAGLSVLLLDRHAFPRDKACGDGLIPDALGCLHRAGLANRIRDAGRVLDRAIVYSPARIRVDLPGEFVVLKRYDLDALLAAEAAARGAVFCRGRVTALESDDDEGVAIRVAGGGDDVARSVRARYALLATGADVSLLDTQGLLERPEPSAFALRCYVRSDHVVDGLLISLDRAILPGYAWIFPLPDGEYNIGCGVFGLERRTGLRNLRDVFDAFVREFPPARDLLERGGEPGPVRGARLRCGLSGSALVGPRTLVVGESAGTTFPFTGEGIGKAMETAEIAAEIVGDAIAASDPRRLAVYPERIERELRPRYRGYEIAQRWLSSAWLADLLARQALRSEYIRRTAAGILAETADPRAVFSLRGLARSLVR